MTIKRISTEKKSRATRVEKVLGGPIVKGGREQWYVLRGGERHTLSTSLTSSMVMSDAMKLYAGALKRLAKR